VALETAGDARVWKREVPEYPDITVYIERLDALLRGHLLRGVRISSPFLLRTVHPPVDALAGRAIIGFERRGKRIVICFDTDLFAVLHLMVAGRLHWKPAGERIPPRHGLGAFDFDHGTLALTEAGTKKRASLHIVQGEAELEALDPGGLEVFEIGEEEFHIALVRENHTLKRSLTDPRIFSGIGNAYSDEILHRARLSPLQLSQKITEEEIGRLYSSTHEVLTEWTDRLREEAGNGFPEKVTAFRPEMAVHGKYGQPCSVCDTAVQRIRYKSRETDYCPTCQTGGRLLADRGLSRLLKKDWPQTVDELEERKSGKR
jgi:formamidopyrimidine-DNA glycosylase